MVVPLLLRGGALGALGRRKEGGGGTFESEMSLLGRKIAKGEAKNGGSHPLLKERGKEASLPLVFQKRIQEGIDGKTFILSRGRCPRPKKGEKNAGGEVGRRALSPKA